MTYNKEPDRSRIEKNINFRKSQKLVKPIENLENSKLEWFRPRRVQKRKKFNDKFLYHEDACL